MQTARVTVFAGHYGSGKTNLAVNYAIKLSKCRDRVTLCDLDIVNPYFRTTDAADLLRRHGVTLISSRFAGTNVDAPAMPAATQAIFDDRGITAVIDLGGDDRGALALGRYAAQLRADHCNMWLVLNPYRPLTRTIEDLAAIRAEIETASRVPFTGLVNNANLGAATTMDDILGTLPMAEEAAQALGLPLVMTSIRQDLLPPQGSEAYQLIESRTAVFPINLFAKADWNL